MDKEHLTFPFHSNNWSFKHSVNIGYWALQKSIKQSMMSGKNPSYVKEYLFGLYLQTFAVMNYRQKCQ